jgi:2-phosphosulfolactate phosphatase
MNSQVPRTVVIDCFPENVARYREAGYVIVAIDVIRATTTAVTAAFLGRKCYPVDTVDNALALGSELNNPLMVGEQGGDMPAGFEIPNSPALVAEHKDVSQPMVLLSTSGTRIIAAAKGSTACYVTCLRNFTAQTEHLIRHHSKVAVIGAGTRGEFREEDQMCCAWIAMGLLDAGFIPENEETLAIAERWRNAPVDALLVSNSVAYLRRSGQLRDLDFVMAHIDDIPYVFELQGEEVVMLSGETDILKGSQSYLDASTPEPQLNANV